ncbi:Ribonuclease P protein subunit p30 [Mucuna pruriens]|uniref:Ribonuclease P protein subunit p30 n=1 Tax=Mucuna pruriens TaxID=157652 RepID=A0A371HLU4_MUCPR|nr:Ribonuclease P protein subunit p30 [Mucuna pruriens]
MGYFDLNIPYPESSGSNKASVQSNRTRLAVKAMELGYTGIAYNRTIKGVMSDQHRCSISPLTLSSLLNVLPSLTLSANLHRHLLRIPLSTPFRQYTRLTVCVDSPSQAQALNSSNPILKTYDLIAVKPSNQTVFDLACERMEVDIISIDFSTKLSFRLKQPMVKAATQRGVCFEVTYSGFFADIQVRRQLISSAKLLMDWTRGQNIIFSSAAPTVNELRGPCDVANLLSLFGLSNERANAAISKNCRILLANSLRKKRFYKEAIRVEVLSSDAASHSKEDLHQELLKWDPISSGEGDILLDDMQKSSLASCKASKTAKAIDFVSVVNSLPSHGFEIKDIMPANNAFPVCSDSKTVFPPVAEKLNQLTPVPNNLTEQSNILDVCPGQDENSLSDAITRSHILTSDNIFEKNIDSGTTEAVNLKEVNIPMAIDSVSVAEGLPSHDFQIKDDKVNFLPVAKNINQSTPVPNNLTVQLDRLDESSQPLKRDDLLEKNIHSGTTEVFNSMTMDISTNTTKLELKSLTDSAVDFMPFGAKTHDSQSNLCISSNTLDTIKPLENEKLCGSSEDAKLDDVHNIDREVEILDIVFPTDKHNNENSSDVNLNEPIGKIHEVLPNEDLKIAEQTVLELNTSICDTSMEDKQFDNRETDTLQVDQKQQLTSYDEMKMEDSSSAAKHLLPDVIMRDKKLGEVNTGSDQFATVHSVSGGLRMKRKTPRGLPLFPFKRLLNPMPFKKKRKRSKSKTKLK